MAKELIVPSKFTIKDGFSAGFKKMMGSADKSADSFKSKMGRMGDFFKNNSQNFQDIGKAAAVGAGIIVGSLGYAANEAVKFEDKMADVAKVMGLDFGSDQFNRIGDDVKELSRYLAVAPEDAAALYANLAQGGAPVEQLGDIAKLAGEIGIAFGISSEQAGESFIKLSNSMGLTVDQTKIVTDSLNHLGNSTAAASDELLEFLSAGGAGAARNLGLLGQEAAAFGSVLISNGKSAAESGTIFERMMKGVFSDKGMKKMFDDAGGGLEGLMAIFEQGASLDGSAQFEFFSKFGQYGTDISLFSKNLGQLKDTMSLVDDEAKFADSSFAEFENRQKTTAVQLQKMKAEFTILAIEIGDAVIPIIRDLMDEVKPLIAGFVDWTKENRGTVKTLVKIAAGVGMFMAVLSPLMMMLGAIGPLIKLVTTAQWLWNVAMAANPIGLLVIAIVAVIAAVVMAIKYFKEWGAAFLFFQGPVGWLINGFMLLKEYWSSIVDAFKTGGIIAGLKRIGVFLLDMVLYPVQQLLSMLAKIPGMADLATGGRDKINELRKNIGAIDIGGELSNGGTLSEYRSEIISQPPLWEGQQNYSEIILKIDNGNGVTTQNITNKDFNMNIVPGLKPTM